MASVSFHAAEWGTINLAGSGLGFFGDGGFGNSVAVDSWQDATYITNGAGTEEGSIVNNIKWVHAESGQYSTANYNLDDIPNRLATLNIRFTHSSAVKCQNPKLRIYDRSNIANPPEGVTCKVAELVHPDGTQGAGGSGDTSWNEPSGTNEMSLTFQSPGISGEAPNGETETSDVRHDYYVAISASPDSVGSKTNFGLYFEVEYL